MHLGANFTYAGSAIGFAVVPPSAITCFMRKSLVLSAVLMASSPAIAQYSDSALGERQQQSVATPIETPPAPAADDTRVRCRSVNLTNSRIPERICRTRAQWDEIERQSREAIARNRRGAGASGN